jgi:SAM-dependent methyltransferase
LAGGEDQYMWTDGYVTDVDYTHGFFSELAPINLSLSMLLGQYDWQPNSSEFAYLELGFGQGISLNVNAAVTPGEYWGNDFHPGHTRNALELGAASRSDISVFEDSFEELASRKDMPDFDAIVLHGIWSWVSDRNREFMIDIIRRKLKPGGICYVSYNTFPGWSDAMPIQQLMSSYAKSYGSGVSESRIDSAIEFVEKLANIGAGFFKEQPSALKQLEKIKGGDRKYIAHEYFNEEWCPMLFGQVAESLSKAKLSFGTSARIIDQIDAVNFSTEARQLIGSIKDSNYAEYIKDFILNRSFRKDIFVKGTRVLSSLEQNTRWIDIPFVIRGTRKDLPPGINTRNGNILFDPKVYEPVIEALSDQNFIPKTLKEIHEHKSVRTLSAKKLSEVLRFLCICRFVAPAQSPDVVQRARARSRALNEELCRRAEFSKDVVTLAAPLIGTGVQVSRIEQLFLRAETLGLRDAPGYTWSILKSQGESVNKDRKPLEGDAENLSELQRHYKIFMEERRPLMVRLGIADDKAV